MITVFQGETGGTIAFENTVATSVSGYIYAVSKHRVMYRFDGTSLSGFLYVAKSGIANTLTPDVYTVLPQVLDSGGRVYFLDVEDLKVVDVPDFFSSALLTPADSLLVRLEALESSSAGLTTYEAGENIQTGKLLAYISGLVYHADARNITHAGRVVGIAIESASTGQSVRVQGSNTFDVPISDFFSVSGPVMLGYNGGVQTFVSNDFAFALDVGVVLSSTKIYLASSYFYTL